jgi:hypothetical protein
VADIRRNRGELAEGWYDPYTLQKATQSTSAPTMRRPCDSKLDQKVEADDKHLERETEDDGQHSDSDDSIGPSLPGQEGRSRSSRMGPSIPGMQDLELKRGGDDTTKTEGKR